MRLAKNRSADRPGSESGPGPHGEGVAGSRPPAGRPPELPLGLALGFYAAVAAVAIAWRGWADGVLPWAAPGGTPWPLPVRLGAGVATGLALVAVSRAFTRRTEAGAALARELGRALGRPAAAKVWALALASGLAEEALFRGALQPQAGWILASLLFGAAHYVPRPGLRVWALWAGFAGALLGGLFELSGDLLAPAIAHVVVNGMNLGWMARTAERDA